MTDKPNESEKIPKNSDTPQAGAFLEKLVRWRGLDKKDAQPQIIPLKEAQSPISETSFSESAQEKAKKSLSELRDALDTYKRIKDKIKVESKTFTKRSDYKYRTAKYHSKNLYYILKGDKEHSDRVISQPFALVWEQSVGENEDKDVRASALMSTKVKKLDSRKARAFIEITGIGGFKGWIDKSALEKPTLGKFHEGANIGEVSQSDVVVVTTTKLETPIYRNADRGEKVKEAYLWTKLRLINTDTNSNRLQVLLPGGKEVGWVQKEDVEVRQIGNPYPKQYPDVITGYARAFSEKSRSYRENAEQNPQEKTKHTFGWGGIYWKRTDSSGFVQTCLRMVGYDLPRNTRSQYRYCKAHPDLFQPLTKKETRKLGDLIFFIKENGEAYHVAIASGDHNYIHSVGINHSNPKKLGVIESCLKDCTTEGHDPYMAKRAVGYVVMRLRGAKETLFENSPKDAKAVNGLLNKQMGETLRRYSLEVLPEGEERQEATEKQLQEQDHLLEEYIKAREALNSGEIGDSVYKQAEQAFISFGFKAINHFMQGERKIQILAKPTDTLEKCSELSRMVKKVTMQDYSSEESYEMLEIGHNVRMKDHIERLRKMKEEKHPDGYTHYRKALKDQLVGIFTNDGFADDVPSEESYFFTADEDKVSQAVEVVIDSYLKKQLGD